MFFGYNTNGFAHHRLEDALAILADLGYGGAAITLDHHVLNPFESGLTQQIRAVRSQLQSLNLRSVVETGSRFLLDPWRKHQPTLLSADPEQREKRLEFLRRAIDIARELQSDVVSFWSGAADEPASEATSMSRLVAACIELCGHAGECGVTLAFEPEPGMFIDTMASFGELYDRVGHPSFGLTIDIGHLHCLDEVPIAGYLRRWSQVLRNVHIEDMRRGVHDHLMFGEGEIEFGPIMSALKDTGYAGGVYVELSRHSHNAVETARNALSFLKGIV
jgi:L-ribulose-5-phosphate 3-epimerase